MQKLHALLCLGFVIVLFSTHATQAVSVVYGHTQLVLVNKRTGRSYGSSQPSTVSLSSPLILDGEDVLDACTQIGCAGVATSAVVNLLRRRTLLIDLDALQSLSEDGHSRLDKTVHVLGILLEALAQRKTPFGGVIVISTFFGSPPSWSLTLQSNQRATAIESLENLLFSKPRAFPVTLVNRRACQKDTLLWVHTLSSLAHLMKESSPLLHVFYPTAKLRVTGPKIASISTVEGITATVWARSSLRTSPTSRIPLLAITATYGTLGTFPTYSNMLADRDRGILSFLQLLGIFSSTFMSAEQHTPTHLKDTTMFTSFPFDIVFLLTPTGRLANYEGTKSWIESHSTLVQDLDFALNLDDTLNYEDPRSSAFYLHLVKRPTSGLGHRIVTILEQHGIFVSTAKLPAKTKNIALEHEQFVRHRIMAGTLSTRQSRSDADNPIVQGFSVSTPAAYPQDSLYVASRHNLMPSVELLLSVLSEVAENPFTDYSGRVNLSIQEANEKDAARVDQTFPRLHEMVFTEQELRAAVRRLRFTLNGSTMDTTVMADIVVNVTSLQNTDDPSVASIRSVTVSIDPYTVGIPTGLSSIKVIFTPPIITEFLIVIGALLYLSLLAACFRRQSFTYILLDVFFTGSATSKLPKRQ